MFLSLCTRPDISCSVNRLAQFASNPTPAHYACAKRILRYLKGTKHLRLRFGGVGDTGALGFSDSDWAGEPLRHSVSGFVWFVAGGPIEWASKRQKSVALSSTEAEYVAVALCLQGGLWIRFALQISHIPFASPSPFRVDNDGATSLSSNTTNHGRSKHIDIKFHFIRNHVEEETFEPIWIPTAENTFTKALPRPLRAFHVEGLSLVSR